MFILRDLLLPLQEEFSNTKQGQKRKVWFTYALLSAVVPFTSSITSDLLRTLQTLFELEIQSQRFYVLWRVHRCPGKHYGAQCGNRYLILPPTDGSWWHLMIQ